MRLKKKNLIILIIILVCIVGLVWSLVDIFVWSKDSKDIDKQLDKIQQVVEVKVVNDASDVEIIEQEVEIAEDNPYWDYIKMDLIDVDFKELKNINKDTRGWIQVNGTNINYPVVQTKDNKYYLNHAFDKSYNQGGWVFLDYRNNVKEEDKNTIIYAHSRWDKTMFGSLKNILKSSWVDDTDNYIVKLSTESENTMWQVFSVYRVPTTSDYLQVDFNNDEEFKVFADMLVERSSYDFETTISGSDRILTLSTCYNDDERVVLHAKLIKRILR